MSLFKKQQSICVCIPVLCSHNSKDNSTVKSPYLIMDNDKCYHTAVVLYLDPDRLTKSELELEFNVRYNKLLIHSDSIQLSSGTESGTDQKLNRPSPPKLISILDEPKEDIFVYALEFRAFSPETSQQHHKYFLSESALSDSVAGQTSFDQDWYESAQGPSGKSKMEPITDKAMHTLSDNEYFKPRRNLVGVASVSATAGVSNHQ